MRKTVQVLESDGGAPPAATGRRPIPDFYIRVPPLVKEFFESQGRNLIPDANRPEYLAMKSAQGQQVIFLSELPSGNRDALVRDARQAGWIVKDDTLVFGDMVLCSQAEEERQYHADQAAALWALQANDDSLVAALNDGARKHLGDMLGGPLSGAGRVNAHAHTITGGGAASHALGGRNAAAAYPGGEGF